ncbi:MAG: AAA family ATPase, partial [Bacteroidales bacterium]
MLSRLVIQNYALIRSVEIAFDKGLSIITGETGAGKSIMLGALGLLTGDRADSSVLLDTEKKCVVEGSFRLGAYDLQPFFQANDLDYEEESLIRREISADGRSRAFVNDTPVTLSVLKLLGSQLIDVHSQHNTQYLHQPAFQLHVVDAFANQLAAVARFSEQYKQYKRVSQQFDALQEESENRNRESNYLQHQFNELQSASLQQK